MPSNLDFSKCTGFQDLSHFMVGPPLPAIPWELDWYPLLGVGRRPQRALLFSCGRGHQVSFERGLEGTYKAASTTSLPPSS